MHNVETLAEGMLLEIDAVMRQMMQLRNSIERIKRDSAKLRGNQEMTDVSTSVLGNGLTDAKIARLINHRNRVEARRADKRNY